MAEMVVELMVCSKVKAVKTKTKLKRVTTKRILQTTNQTKAKVEEMANAMAVVMGTETIEAKAVKG